MPANILLDLRVERLPNGKILAECNAAHADDDIRVALLQAMNQVGALARQILVDQYDGQTLTSREGIQ